MITLQKITVDRLAEIDRGPGSAERIGGLGKNYVSDIVRGKKLDVRASYLPKFARALDWSVEELRTKLGEIGREPTQVELADLDNLPIDVPVMGLAAASVAGAFIMDGVIDRVRRPPGLLHAKNVYALYVHGESMMPRYRPGDLIFVSPDRPPVQGDDVVVQTQNHPTAIIQSWLKQYVRKAGGRVYAHQFNPDSTVEFMVEQVLNVHRVLTTRELFGA